MQNWTLPLKETEKERVVTEEENQEDIVSYKSYVGNISRRALLSLINYTKSKSNIIVVYSKMFFVFCFLFFFLSTLFWMVSITISPNQVNWYFLALSNLWQITSGMFFISELYFSSLNFLIGFFCVFFLSPYGGVFLYLIQHTQYFNNSCHNVCIF